MNSLSYSVRYVPREFDFSNLLKVSTLPATYELAVERDYRTGEVLAFTEVGVWSLTLFPSTKTISVIPLSGHS